MQRPWQPHRDKTGTADVEKSRDIQQEQQTMELNPQQSDNSSAWLPSCDRRKFLKTAALSAGSLAIVRTPSVDANLSPAPSIGTTVRLTDHLFVYQGAINIGIVRYGHQALLVDCGDEDVGPALQQLGVTDIVKVVFTHGHRDQTSATHTVARSAKIGAPAKELRLFSDPATYWKDDRNLYRVYKTFRPDHLTPIEPLRIDESFSDGDRFSFGETTIQVIETPGHTDGSVSYVIDSEGKRFVFSGDCIFDEGQIWDVFSLQRGFERNGRRIGGYHGFMGDQWRLISSLNQLKKLRPEVLVPSHGTLMRNVPAAVDGLVKRLGACYENYVSISALRHYFPKLFTNFADRPGQMPIRAGIEPPSCLKHFGTTWMLISKSKAALVMDVGSPGTVQHVKKMLDRGEIKKIDALWVTHYHFDHTDGILEFQKAFDCPCIMDRRLADVMGNPAAWRLPCLAPDPIRIDQQTDDGHSWRWHEFDLTAYFYPGQTLYHDALLAESDDLRMFFVGDSHTMAGIDDYCAYNRNLLGPGVGFQYCLDLIEKLKPTHMFNCHVADAFTFTEGEIRFMRNALDQREQLFGQLVPWAHANYGLDPSWVRCDPYRQEVSAGGRVQCEVVVTNHSARDQATSVRLVLPRKLGKATLREKEAVTKAKKEHRFDLSFQLASRVAPGRHVIPIDVQHGSRHLPQFAEMIIDVVT